MGSGLRGFAVGSFALVVLYVAVQPNSPRAVAAGGNVLTSLLRRLLSGDVAGIPQRKGSGSIAPGTTVGSAVGGAVSGTPVPGPPGPSGFSSVQYPPRQGG